MTVRQREVDLALLREILSSANEPELSGYEKAAFTRMLAELEAGSCKDGFGNTRKILSLTAKQRLWAQDVSLRLKPFDSKLIPRGREIKTPEILLKRPLRPPTRVS